MKRAIKAILSLLVVVVLIKETKASPDLFLSFDDNLNGTHSASINGMASYVEGVENQSLQFSSQGDRQVVTVPDYPLKITSQSDFSLQIWVKTTQSSASTSSFLGTKDFVPGFASKERSDGIALFTNSGTLGFNFGANYSRLTYLRENGTYYPINDGVWHQITITYESAIKTMKLYYDGKLIANYLMEKIGDFSLEAPLVLGADGDGLSDESWKRFDGAIDNFGIWQKALSLDEIEASYKKFFSFTSPVLEDSLKTLRVAVWNTQEGGLVPKSYDGRVRIAEMLQELNVDIALIQENYSSGDMVSAHLGYYFAISADNDYLNQGSNMAIHSRFPIDSLFGIDSLAFRHLGAKIHLSKTQDLFIASNWYREGEGAGNLQTLLPFHQDHFSAKDSIPFLWGGDYNEGSPVDGKSGSSHTKMTEAGFTDLYRALHPNASTHPGYTHVNTRIDFLYKLGSGLKATKVQNISQWDGGFPSDHNLLVFDFDVNYKTHGGVSNMKNFSQDASGETIKIQNSMLILPGKANNIQLCNMRGQLLRTLSTVEENGISQVSLRDLSSSFSNGMYLLTGTVNNHSFTQLIRLGR